MDLSDSQDRGSGPPRLLLRCDPSTGGDTCRPSARRDARGCRRTLAQNHGLSPVPRAPLGLLAVALTGPGLTPLGVATRDGHHQASPSASAGDDGRPRGKTSGSKPGKDAELSLRDDRGFEAGAVGGGVLRVAANFPPRITLLVRPLGICLYPAWHWSLAALREAGRSWGPLPRTSQNHRTAPPIP